MNAVSWKPGTVFFLAYNSRMLKARSVGIVITSEMTGYGTKGAIWESLVLIDGKIININNVTHDSRDLRSLIET